MCEAHDIMAEVLASFADADKWVGAPFEQIKRLSNSKVGDVGQDFIERLCRCIGLACEFPLTKTGKRSRRSAWDIAIEGKTFELKTATEDVSRSFQFNHIRYHRTYDAVLCLGIAPDSIYFDAWSKADVATGNAGRLVSMEKQGTASYKLTKKPESLKPISEFENHILDLLTS